MILPQLPEFRVGRTKDKILSPVSGYYRGKSQIAREPIMVQAVLPFVTRSADERLILIKNSKSGCTSLAHAIYTYDTGKGFAGNIHRDGRHLAQGYRNWRENWMLLQRHGAFTVSAVRQPTDRIKSAFLDFVVEKRNVQRVFHEETFHAFRLDQIDDIGKRFDAFLDMVEESLAVDAWRTDRHWRPQVFNLWVERIEYDLLIRTDKLEQGFQALRDRMGVTPDRLPLVHKNKSADQTAFTLSPNQLRRIQQMYARDFELFEGIA